MKKQFSSSSIKLLSFFASLAIIGSLVLQFPFVYKTGLAPSYIDTLFTSVSALCVTGLSTVDMAIYTNYGFLVILLLIEVGGLGLISFFTIFLVLPTNKLSLVNRRIVKDYFISDVEMNPVRIIREIIIYTVTIQLIGAILLSIFFHSINQPNPNFYAAFISVSAFCNAGFSPFSDSLVGYNTSKYVCIIVMVLIVLGGLGFTVIKDILSFFKTCFSKAKRTHKLALHSKIVLLMTSFLILIPAIIFLLSEWNSAFKSFSISDKICNAFFQSITTRTAGFETIAQKDFSPLATFISELLMIIGGNPGSMAGGIKTTTFFLTFCLAFRSKDDINNITVLSRDISDENINKATSVMFKAGMFLCAMLCLLFIVESNAISNGIVSVDDLIFELCSALGTAGLSKGITSLLSPLAKLIIIVTMFVGRTGVLTMSLNVNLTSQQIKRYADYPSENVLVG